LKPDTTAGGVGRMLGVAPLAGAWIETNCDESYGGSTYRVAPLAGAWIETSQAAEQMTQAIVAPLAGAWIETRSYFLPA